MAAQRNDEDQWFPEGVFPEDDEDYIWLIDLDEDLDDPCEETVYVSAEGVARALLSFCEGPLGQFLTKHLGEELGRTTKRGLIAPDGDKLHPPRSFGEMEKNDALLWGIVHSWFLQNQQGFWEFLDENLPDLELFLS